MPSTAPSRQPYNIRAHFQRGLVWLRRNLRHIDHATLHYALRHCREVYCVFVFDRDIPDALFAHGLKSDHRVEFIRTSIEKLRGILRGTGGDLIVVHDRPCHTIPKIAHQLNIEAVLANHDGGPSAQARDKAVRKALVQQPCAWLDFKDQVIFERDEVLNGQGKPYDIFTPYKNTWLAALMPFDLRMYPTESYFGALAEPPEALAHPTPALETIGFARTNLSETALLSGMSGGQTLLDEFEERMDDYHTRRDFPTVRGPGYLSTHLRSGTMSIHALAARTHASMLRGSRDTATWLSKLVWRDFYFVILHHRPDLANDVAFHPEFDRIRWVDGGAGDARLEA